MRFDPKAVGLSLVLAFSMFGCAVGSETEPVTDDSNQTLDQAPGEGVLVKDVQKEDRSIAELRAGHPIPSLERNPERNLGDLRAQIPIVEHTTPIDRVGQRPYLPPVEHAGKLRWKPRFDDESTVPTDPTP